MRSETSQPEKKRPPGFGELARGFTVATGDPYGYSFEAAAGRWMILMFFGTLSREPSRQAIESVLRRHALFDGQGAAFYAVGIDRTLPEIADTGPGVCFFTDIDGAIGRLYGVADDQTLWPAVFLIDPTFRVVMSKPLEGVGDILHRLEQELRDAAAREDGVMAPILIVPRILEPQLCIDLIDYFRKGSPKPSGFAMTRDGRTVEQIDPTLKRRQDVYITREDLRGAVRRRLESRLFPMIKRAFGWQATHIERDLICRYSAADQGFFTAHRDDVTAGSAHRKFAVSINLNAEDHEGGDLRFPEFGRRNYRPPTGGAAVFGCNLLHEATPVTRGERFVVVPFLFDDAGEALRRKNLGLVDFPVGAAVLPRV